MSLQQIRPPRPSQPADDDHPVEGNGHVFPPPPTTFVTFPLMLQPSNSGTPSPKIHEHEEEEQDIHYLSEVESQYTRTSKVTNSELSEAEESDDEAEDNPCHYFATPKIKNFRSRSSMIDEDEEETHPNYFEQQSLQSCGDSTCEEGSIASARASYTSHTSSSAAMLQSKSPAARYRALLHDAKEQAKLAQAELEIVQTQLQTLQQRHLVETQDLNRQFIIQQAKEHDLRLEIRNGETEMKHVRRRLHELIKEKDSLKSAVEAQAQMIEQQVSEHETLLKAFELKLQRAAFAKVDAERRLEEALERVSVLEEQLTSAMEVTKQVRFADQNDVVYFNSSDYANQLQQVTEENTVLRVSVETLKADVEKLREERAFLKIKFHDESAEYKRSAKKAQEELSTAKNQVRNLLSNLVKMQQDSERLHQERTSLEQQLKEAIKHRDDAQSKLASKDKEWARIQKEVSKVNHAITSLKDVEQRLSTNSKPQFRAEGGDQLLLELEKARFRLEKEAAIIKQRLQDIQQQLNDATERCSKATDQLAVVELERTELLQQVSNLKRTVAALRDENERLRLETTLLERAVLEQTHLFEASQCRLQVLEQERDELHTQLKDLQQVQRSTQEDDGHNDEQLNTLVSNVVEAELRVSAENVHLELLQRENEYLKTKLDEACLNLEEMKKQMEQQKTSQAEALQEQIQRTEQARSNMIAANTRADNLEREQDNTRKQVLDLLDDKVLLQKQVDAVHDQLEASETERRKLQNLLKEIDQASDEKADLQKKLNKTQAALIDANNQINKKNNDLQAMQQKINFLQAVEETLIDQIDSLQSEDRMGLSEQGCIQRELSEQIKCIKEKSSSSSSWLSDSTIAAQNIVSSGSKDELAMELAAPETKMAVLDQKSMDAVQYAKNISDTEIALAVTQLMNIKVIHEELQKEHNCLTNELKTAVSQLAQFELERDNALEAAEVYKLERDRAVLAEIGLCKMQKELQEKVDDQAKKVKKLAKLLKYTLKKQAEKDSMILSSPIKHVSHLPTIMKLRYKDKESGATSAKEVNADYTGQVIVMDDEDKPHGAGMLQFESGDLYLGEFRFGEMNGTGTYVRQRSSPQCNKQN